MPTPPRIARLAPLLFIIVLLESAGGTQPPLPA